MTATAPSATEPARAVIAPGSRAFVLILAMGMAATALGVDTVLPAFPEIRSEFGLASDSTQVTGLITFFLMGSSFGLLPAGLLADRFGRRPVMWGGLALYTVGAVGALLAPSLGLMFAARFVWGLGSAGPRVAAMAMVRDAYSGEQMARQMSFIMAVFILVPTFAPAMSSGLLAVGPWQVVFWVCAAAGIAVAFAIALLPETLTDDDRRRLSAREIGQGCRAVLATPGTWGYLVSLTALFGVFMSYLASSEILIDQVFGLDAWFPVFFGGIAVVMGLGMYLNGRLVERVGLDRMLGRVFGASVVAVVALLVVGLATSGKPPFWLFVVGLSAVLFAHQMLIPNLNAAAMRPLSHVAGTGAAILGMVSGVGGALIGGFIDRRFDGSITPLSIGFVAGTAVSIAGWRWAETARTRTRTDTPTRHDTAV